jgi:hypothetical protein
MKTKIYESAFIVFILSIFVFGFSIANGAPVVNILGNRVLVGLNATTTANGHFTASGTIVFVSLASSTTPCLTINGSGTVGTATCSTSSFTTTTLNGLSATAYTFATSSDTNLGIEISGSGSTLTWTSKWIGTLADARIASAGTWNGMTPSSTQVIAGTGLTGGGALIGNVTLTNNGVLSLTAGTGITVSSATGTPTIANNGVTSLTASSSIGITSATGTVGIGAKNYPIQFIIESPTSSENDNIFIFNTTSTITKVLAVNKSASDTVTFGLGYSSSQGTATSSLTNLFAAQTITSTSTPISVSLTAASSTPGLHNVLKLWTTAASSTQFTLTIYYTEN